MKPMICFLLLPLIIIGCRQEVINKTDPVTVNLVGDWQFRKVGDSAWYQATVPGTVHTDLIDNKLIDDPFFGMNEHHLQWVDKADWEYKTSFRIENDIYNMSAIFLDFEGLDTYANVYLNDQLILTADNMFRSWKVDCKKYLKQGDNELYVLLRSPIRIGLEKLKKQGYPLPASNDQSENGNVGKNKVSVFTRKAGYHFGWDWGPRLVTSGIWRPVKLLAYDLVNIENVQIICHHLTDSVADITATIELTCLKPAKYEFEIFVDGISRMKTAVNTGNGNQELTFDFDIENPKKWWPNGLGEPYLYNILIRISDTNLIAEENTKIGLRDLKLVQKPDPSGNGRSFYFEVNGIPVFAKGANYIPNDVFLPRVSPSDYQRIAQAAADANMNMLRVWGGGIYENDFFYDLCDQQGIMVWQDFMYACSMYPGDSAYLNNARLEAEENIRRLRNHPCLALWCGNNEIEVAWAENETGKGWGWKERYTPQLRRKIWHDYDTLFHQILPEAVQRLDPRTTYWPSSPSAAGDQLATYESNSGDMHYWGVWHGEQPFSDFRKYRARFMSEYGFQSFSELNTVKTYARPPDWDIESDVMASHQRSGIGNLRIRQYMEQDYRIPDDFEQFLYVSQLLQAEGIKMAIEAHRTEEPYCMGSLYWQLNDCWPVASWSGIDYTGRWKALHYTVKDAFKPQIVVLFQDKDSLEIHAVSDDLNDHDARIMLRLSSFSGTTLWEKKLDFTSKGNASMPVTKIALQQFYQFGDPDEMVLVAKLYVDEVEADDDFHYFVKPKDLKLMDPQPEYTVAEKEDHFDVYIQVNNLTKNIFFSTDVSTDHFSDNFFDLMPGDKKVISYPKTGNLETFTKSLKVTYLQKFD